MIIIIIISNHYPALFILDYWRETCQHLTTTNSLSLLCRSDLSFTPALKAVVQDVLLFIQFIKNLFNGIGNYLLGLREPTEVYFDNGGRGACTMHDYLNRELCNGNLYTSWCFSKDHKFHPLKDNVVKQTCFFRQWVPRPSTLQLWKVIAFEMVFFQNIENLWVAMFFYKLL